MDDLFHFEPRFVGKKVNLTFKTSDNIRIEASYYLSNAFITISAPDVPCTTCLLQNLVTLSDSF